MEPGTLDYYRDSILLDKRETKYQSVEIRRHRELGKCLLIDDEFMSSDVGDDYDAYVQSLLPDKKERILILGGGDCSLAYLLQNQKEVQSIEIRDIDEEATDLIDKWFGFRSSLNSKCKVKYRDATYEYGNYDVVIDDMVRNPIGKREHRQELTWKCPIITHFPGPFSMLTPSNLDTKKMILAFDRTAYFIDAYISCYYEHWSFARYQV